MLVKALLALAITVIISFTGSFRIDNMRNGINDIDKQNMLCLMDQAIINYYYSHSGQLPSYLDDNTLKSMGLQDKWSDFTYSSSSGKFTLTATLTNGNVISSPNSGKSLSEIYDEDTQVRIK